MGGKRVASDSADNGTSDGERILETRNARGNERNVCCAEIVGTLCARDYKGLSIDDLHNGKYIIE